MRIQGIEETIDYEKPRALVNRFRCMRSEYVWPRRFVDIHSARSSFAHCSRSRWIKFRAAKPGLPLPCSNHDQDRQNSLRAGKPIGHVMESAMIDARFRSLFPLAAAAGRPTLSRYTSRFCDRCGFKWGSRCLGRFYWSVGFKYPI